MLDGIGLHTLDPQAERPAEADVVGRAVRGTLSVSGSNSIRASSVPALRHPSRGALPVPVEPVVDSGPAELTGLGQILGPFEVGLRPVLLEVGRPERTGSGPSRSSSIATMSRVSSKRISPGGLWGKAKGAISNAVHGVSLRGITRLEPRAKIPGDSTKHRDHVSEILNGAFHRLCSVPSEGSPRIDQLAAL